MFKKSNLRLLSILLILAMVLAGCATPAAEAPATENEATTEAAETEPEPEASGDPIFLTIGTASVGGMNYPIGVALAQIFNRNIPNAKAVAIATNGSPHNIDLLRTMDIELSVCRAIEAEKASLGIEPYPEEMPWISALTGGLFYDANQVVALKDKGIETIADFKGMKIAVGPIGSGGEVDSRMTLAAYGLTYDDVDEQYLDASQAIEMMEDGLIDGAILGLTMGSAAISELMLSGKTIILPISDDALEQIKLSTPSMQRRILPAGVYPNQDYDVATVGSPPDHIITRSDETSDELAYQMTKYIYENLDDLHAVSQVMEQFGPDLVTEESEMLIPYHPGSKKYFLEQGWITE